ncbi:MAG: biopolymer transporter ExbD [Calditrichaceae bacterium]|jgi:biopolymer transport protein ExbD
MAYKPSMRRKSDDVDMELDIRPVMNLMVVLIPLLIASAEWVRLGSIEINVPPSKAGAGDSGDEADNEEVEKEKKLGLSIAITDLGITIASPGAVLTSEENQDGPTIPILNDGKQDYDALKEKLIEIKKAIAGKGYKDENRAVITAAGDIEYQVIVKVMDYLQTYENDEKTEILPLFPEVNFSKII